MSKKEMALSLEELRRLVDTAGGEVVGEACQEIKRVDPSTFIGKGKVEEIGMLAEGLDADIVIIDDDISPVQNKNLEDRLGLFVLDRTAVILDIFALRAHTKEGKLQVELAQLEYLAPRLVGRGKMFSQQAGHIGTRGPGETALEYDRRRIKEKITKLRRSLEGVKAHRRIHRMKRDSVPIPLVSMVGYTNAGKSTLMNAMTDANVFVEDKLFATLDPTVRKLRLPSGREVLLADTVGFIRRLPHELIESFRSTFEEVAYSHVLLHIIDGSDVESIQHAGIVEDVLAEMNLNHKPRVDVINKTDMDEIYFKGDKDSIKVSALKGSGIRGLLDRLDEVLKLEFRRVLFRFPLDRGDILSSIYRLGYVWRVEYEGDGILVDCELHQKFYGKYRSFEIVED